MYEQTPGLFGAQVQDDHLWRVPGARSQTSMYYVLS